ncbi:precorrin-6y C5,15-methyltransferase (decarboxylating) subunit CbiE [Clostridium sp. DJ247]|nr:precorrin-6y C5,15-methyltransferase (decarboxylating) subunit CbiE [Clostridium sp. DJ247]
MVYIVGIGPGSSEYILPKAIKTLEASDIVIGFQRAIESIDFISTKKIIVKKLSEILQFINMNSDKTVSIAASGDPLFYGITDYVRKNFSGNIQVIPGLSSFQYLMAKIGLSWQGSFLGSVHGREESFCNMVKGNKLSIWLTDSKHSPSYLSRILEENNINANIYVGENLSYEDEKITIGNIEKIKHMSFSELCVVVIDRGE